MKNYRDPAFSDRVVLLGGLLAVICTGFFGAEPPATEQLSSIRTIPYIQFQCTETLPRSRWCAP